MGFDCDLMNHHPIAYELSGIAGAGFNDFLSFLPLKRLF